MKLLRNFIADACMQSNGNYMITALQRNFEQVCRSSLNFLIFSIYVPTKWSAHQNLFIDRRNLYFSDW